MRSEYTQKFNPELVEMNEKLRKDVMRGLEAYGAKQISDLPGMSESERSKWFFWNLHENLEEFRTLEPTLVGQVMCTQLSFTDGQRMETERIGAEKRATIQCKWHLRLAYSAIQTEETYPIGEGSVDLSICNDPPTNPSLREQQKGYLDSDSSMYPNQLFLYGWVNERIWEELKSHLFNPIPYCHTDLILRDNYLFPVKAGFDFVVGPPGSIGITNMEFRVSYSSGERRTNRRNESL